jgi:PAS domain S-box-containing protein
MLQQDSERDHEILALVVDDDPNDLKLLCRFLSDDGYRVESASDGLDALGKAVSLNPDIILLDVYMPGVNGIEICRRLKKLEETRHIPVISITGMSDMETKIECLEAGANVFISKPVNAAEMLIKVRNLIRLRDFENIKMKSDLMAETISVVEKIKRQWEDSMDCISDIVVLADADSRVIRCNKALCSLLGLGYEDIISHNWPDLLSEGGFSGVRDFPESGEICHDSGRWFTVGIYKINGSLRDSSSLATVITLHDITESKQTQEALKISEEYFRSFMESSQDCVANLSKDGLFLSMNDAGLRLQGFDTAGDVAGMRLTDTVMSDKAPVEAAILNSGAGEVTSVRYMSRDGLGGELWWDAKLTPVMDIDGSVRSLLLVARDITEQKRSEEALNQKNLELEKAYAELKSAQSRILQQEKLASVGQLAAGIAHEINNPMGFIISNINTLNKYLAKIWRYVGTLEGVAAPGREIEEERKTLKIAFIREDTGSLIAESLEGAERVKKIVQDLKSFSRLDEAEYKFADINAGLESTINIVWNELKYKVSMVKQYGELPLTKCNPGQLNQVFMNILVNAAQAIETSGEIFLKTWSEDRKIYILISDTGCGMPHETMEKIFEPFYTTKDVGKGTGLGLSIAYDIVKKHNGDIRVESEIGRGTSFTIIIPVVED